MPLDFPSSPSLNQTYTLGPKTWKWNGYGWELVGTNIGYTGSAGSGYTGSQGGTGYTGSAGSINAIGSNVDFSGFTAYNVLLKNYSTVHQALGSVSGSQTLNMQLANYFSITATSDVTFTFTNPVSSPDVTSFVLKIVNGGDYVITWPASVRWPAATAPVLTAGGTDFLVFFTDDGGSNWRGVVSIADSR